MLETVQALETMPATCDGENGSALGRDVLKCTGDNGAANGGDNDGIGGGRW